MELIILIAISIICVGLEFLCVGAFYIGKRVGARERPIEDKPVEIKAITPLTAEQQKEYEKQKAEMEKIKETLKKIDKYKGD